MAYIKVNFKQLLKDNLFSPLRNFLNESWHNYLNTAVDGFYTQLLNIRENNLYLTNHTSQKISLEHLFNTVNDQFGNKLIFGSPVTCETTGNIPLFYFWTFDERDSGLVPSGVQGTYSYDNQAVTYDPTLAISWTDDEIYDGSGNIQIPYEELSWMFTDETTGINQYTIWVDPIDYIGFSGTDENGNPTYVPGSKLDVIDKYAKQYTIVGVQYTILSR